MKDPKCATLGEYDYRGEFAPARDGSSTITVEMSTFSLGVFRWVPRKRGRGLKPGKVIRRFRAAVHEPEKAYRRAEGWIRMLNSQLSLFDDYAKVE